MPYCVGITVSRFRILKWGRKEQSAEIKDMKTMKKPIFVIFLLSIIICMSLMYSCSSSKNIAMNTTITMLNYNNDYVTEWNDGKFWAYKNDKDYMIGITISKAKDHFGVFQMNLIVKNKTDGSLIFDPAGISVELVTSGGSEQLGLYEYPFVPNIDMATYDKGENIYLLSKMADRGENFKQIGYLRKNTVYEDQGIMGYLNFDLGESGTGMLNVDIPVGDKICHSEWYIGKEPIMPVVYKTTGRISIVDHHDAFEKAWKDGVLWVYKKTRDYVVGLALCASDENEHDYQLNLAITSFDGHLVRFNPADITVTLVSGTDVNQPLSFEFSYQNQDAQNGIGYIKRSKGDAGIIKVDVPIGNEIHTFQWSIKNF